MKLQPSSGHYVLEKAKRDNIESFSQWMEGWNAFLQTRLSFKPDEAFDLFTHQRLITKLATQFRFQAVYSYDMNFRQAMANQRGHPDSCTISWGQKDPELSVYHLTEDQRLPPPRCYKCNEKGHLATNCTGPKTKEVSSASSGGNSGRSRQNNQNNGRQEFRNGASDEAECCDHWNSRRGCNRTAERCKFQHKCNRCKATNEHKGPNCDRVLTTGFRPGH